MRLPSRCTRASSRWNMFSIVVNCSRRRASASTRCTSADAFLRHAAELLVEVADLFLEIADPLARVIRVCLRLRGLLAQLLDVRDEVGADRLDALVELNDLVRGGADLNYGVFVGKDHVLDRAILLSHRADHLREIDRVPRLVVRLLREAARQVGVIAVLVELPLGLREEGSRALVGLRREARYAALVRFGEQRARLAQVLRLDRRELRVAIERLGLVRAGCARRECRPFRGASTAESKRSVALVHCGAAKVAAFALVASARVLIIDASVTLADSAASFACLNAFAAAAASVRTRSRLRLRAKSLSAAA